MAAPPPPDPDFDLTAEIGTPNSGIAPWSAFYDSTEDVAELAWPNSVKVYDRMRNDEQIAALLLAFMLPIFGYRWYIDPNGARDEVVEHVATDFGLPIKGTSPDEPAGRQRDRFSHGDYLRHSRPSPTPALLSKMPPECVPGCESLTLRWPPTRCGLRKPVTTRGSNSPVSFDSVVGVGGISTPSSWRTSSGLTRRSILGSGRA